jgi:hypothetical protein
MTRPSAVTQVAPHVPVMCDVWWEMGKKKESEMNKWIFEEVMKDERLDDALLFIIIAYYNKDGDEV